MQGRLQTYMYELTQEGLITRGEEVCVCVVVVVVVVRG